VSFTVVYGFYAGKYKTQDKDDKETKHNADKANNADTAKHNYLGVVASCDTRQNQT